jgi:hypothetical protein
LSPLRRPPNDLTNFPFYDLTRRERLYRIHRAERTPWWFSTDGSGRFDLSGGRGTCYLAVTPVGAFIEVFRVDAVIPELEVEARVLSTLAAPKSVRIADCTVSRARRFGITGAIHTQPDYAPTREWAEALAAAGFDGIRYRLSHDPAQKELGFALFGPTGEGKFAIRKTEVVPARVVDEARRRFGLVVAPTPA